MLERVPSVAKEIFRYPRRRAAPSRIALQTAVVDPEQVAAQLGVDDRARRAAVDWGAGHAARGPDADEQHIRRHHEEMLRGVVASSDHAMRELWTRWQAAAQKADPRRVRELLDKAQQDIVQKNARLREQLLEARRAVVDARRRSRALRDPYPIDPPAEPGHRGVILGGLVFGVALEALFNAHFFALGEQDGLLGGFTMAFLAALVNVAASFFAGWAMRGTTIPGPRRIIGGASAVVWTLGLITFQLAIGHYRAALGRVPAEQAMATAIDTLTSHPLFIQDLAAWLLVLVGLSFAVLAAFAGFALADPIPGWREAGKRLRAAEEAYTALKDRFLTGVQQAYDEQVATADRLLAEARDAEAGAVRDAAEMHRCLGVHAAAAASVAASYATTIRRYRQVFERVAGRPGPESFRGEPRLPIPALVDGGTFPTLEQMCAERERQLGMLADVADEVRRTLRDCCMAAMTALPVLIADIERIAEGLPVTAGEPGTPPFTTWPTLPNGGAHVCPN